MIDGSHLPLEENILFTKYISSLAQAKGMLVEAELGRLSGTEDGLTVEAYEARLTDVTQVNLLCYSMGFKKSTCWRFNVVYFTGDGGQAQEFIDKTNIDALAVCVGNVHGSYPPSGPNLRLDLLKVR